MPNAPLAAEVRAFFDKYNEAFASLDGKVIAACYHAPMLTIRGDGSIHCLASEDEVAKFFQGVVDGYAKEGGAGRPGGLSNLEVTALGGTSVLATMQWEMLNANGSVIRSWRQSYNLVRVGKEWRILVSTFHVPQPGETAA
jgi:hypothetical protein